MICQDNSKRETINPERHLPKIKSPVNPLQHVIRTIIWANKWYAKGRPSNHRVDINKRPSEIISKKGYQEPGIPPQSEYYQTDTQRSKKLPKWQESHCCHMDARHWNTFSLVTPGHNNHQHSRSLAIASCVYPVIAVSSVKNNCCLN